MSSNNHKVWTPVEIKAYQVEKLCESKWRKQVKRLVISIRNSKQRAHKTLFTNRVISNMNNLMRTVNCCPKLKLSLKLVINYSPLHKIQQEKIPVRKCWSKLKWEEWSSLIMHQEAEVIRHRNRQLFRLTQSTLKIAHQCQGGGRVKNNRK